MSRWPRNTDPSLVRHISIRTERAELRLLPGAALNELVGGVLAKYQEAFGIIIFAYTVLGNHIHILAQAPKKNLWRFEQAVNRELAKRINRLQGRRGHFWERRYDEQIAPEDNDVLEAFLYVVCNAVGHGLVEHPSLWPGLNCYAQVLDGKDRRYRFTDYTSYGKAYRKARRSGQRVSIRDYQSEHCLRLSPLAQHKELSVEQRRAVLLRLINERSLRIRQERKEQGLGFLGRERVLAQRLGSIPRSVKRRPRPICYTKNFETKQRFLSWFLPWLESFRAASASFRSGDFSARFPEHCLLPPLHYALE